MQDRIIRLALLIATGLAVTTGSLAASPSEPCRPPSYQIVQTRWDQDSSEGVAKRIVIALRDFAPERSYAWCNRWSVDTNALNTSP